MSGYTNFMDLENILQLRVVVTMLAAHAAVIKQ
jgi:hypothetical protein